MYSTFSHTFTTPTQGAKKFYLTYSRTAAEPTFDGKINDDKTVSKFQMKKDDSGQWKIQNREMPDWVLALEPEFSERIEMIAARQ